jgi:hypothetical protein
MCVSTGNKWADLAIVIVASVVTYGAATGWFAAAGTGAAAAGGGGAAALGVGGGATSAGSAFAGLGAGAAGFGGTTAAGTVGAGLSAAATTASIGFTLTTMGQQQDAINAANKLPFPKAMIGSNPLQTTGSGGSNAPAVLAAKIKSVQKAKAQGGTGIQAVSTPTDTGLQLSAA